MAARESFTPARKRFGKWLLLAVLTPNLAFFAAHYAARCLPVAPIRGHISLALERGDILTDTKQFVFLDSARGAEPWGDANTLRMAIHRGPSKLRDALAPRLLAPADGVERHPTQELQGELANTLRFDPNSGYYHRYWHGNVVITAGLLTIGDLRQVRLWLMTASYFLFMLLPLAACLHSPRFGIFMGIVSGFGVWFSSLPYHGQTLAYAPAFLYSQAIVLAALWFRRRNRTPEYEIPFGLAAGAVAAFVEPMSGTFLLSGGMCFLTLYFGCREADRGKSAFLGALAGYVALLLGLVLSIFIKQVVVAMVFGWGPTFGVFFGQLKWRMGLTGEHASVFKVVQTVGVHLVYLTFGSPGMAAALLGATAVSAGTSAALTFVDMRRQRPNPRAYDYLALAVPVAPIAAWYFILPSHNVIHAWITVRLLYLPMALCFVWAWMSVRAALDRPLTAAARRSAYARAD